MATKEKWDLDPWDDAAVNRAVVGRDEVDIEEQRRQVATIIGNHSGVRSMEIGAGYGRLLPFVNSRFHLAYGVDSSVSLVAKSTIHLRDYHNCRVFLSDGLNIPFLGGMFDFVYSFTCFQHMTEYSTVVANLMEAHRVLARGKICRIQTVCGDPAEEGRYDGIVFKEPQLFGNLMREAGFKNVKAYFDGNNWIWVTGEKQ